MVQKSLTERRPRGRPRDYDPEQALQQALEVFWKAGYAGTSLAGLASAVHATLDVRARAGIARAELEEFARKSVESICRNP
jgi:hypothetical protein